jgi:hypothetical protein
MKSVRPLVAPAGDLLARAGRESPHRVRSVVGVGPILAAPDHGP